MAEEYRREQCPLERVCSGERKRPTVRIAELQGVDAKPLVTKRQKK